MAEFQRFMDEGSPTGAQGDGSALGDEGSPAASPVPTQANYPGAVVATTSDKRDGSSTPDPLNANVVSGQYQIRIVASVVLVCGIIQLSLDSYVYSSVTEVYLGGWWAGTLAVIVAVLAVFAKSREMVYCTCFLSVVAVLAGVVSCFLDGIGSNVIGSISACASGPNTRASASSYPGVGVTLSGDDSDYQGAYDCYADYIHLNNDCVCITKGSSTCYFYNGPLPSQSCDLIFHSYSDSIKGAVTMDVIVTVITILLSIVTCTALFCPTVLGEYQFGAFGADTADVGTTSFERVVSMRPSSTKLNLGEDTQHFIGRAASYRNVRTSGTSNDSAGVSRGFSPSRTPSFRRTQNNPVFTQDDYETEVQL
jgi:hypothetical protein